MTKDIRSQKKVNGEKGRLKHVFANKKEKDFGGEKSVSQPNNSNKIILKNCPLFKRHDVHSEMA